MLTETTILILGGYSLAALGIFSWFRLKHEAKLKSKYKGLLIENSKLKGNLKRSNTKVSESNADIGGLASMGKKELMEITGMDESTYKVAKPFIDKILSRLAGGESDEQQSGGY